MIRKIAVAMIATSALATPALAQEAAAGGAEDGNAIIVTAARTILPANALPLTIDLIDKAALDEQLAISGSVTDAVATLTPSFSPTRQKLSGAGETLRGRSPLLQNCTIYWIAILNFHSTKAHRKRARR